MGYFIVNDISEREFQIERSGQWDKGKGCDTFGPIGPYLVTKDEIKDIQNLNLEPNIFQILKTIANQIKSGGKIDLKFEKPSKIKI